MKPIRNIPEFTHFACVPFIRKQYRQTIFDIQYRIKEVFAKYYDISNLIDNNPNLSHVTLSMLTLHRQDTRQKAYRVMQSLKESIQKLMKNTHFNFVKVGYFSKNNMKTRKSEPNVIYLQIQKEDQYKKLMQLQDLYIRAMMKQEVIVREELKQMFIKYDHNDGRFKNDHFHLTLFRVKNIVEDQRFESFFSEVSSIVQPLSMDCDMVDISTRGHYDKTQFYQPFYRIQLQPSTKQLQSQIKQQRQSEPSKDILQISERDSK